MQFPARTTMAIRIGRRRFAPSRLMTLITLVLLAAFVSLGRWQWDRGEQKRATWESFARSAETARPLGTRGLHELERYTRLELTGRFDVERQFLLDNRVLGGRAGYEVLTPFVLADGRALLVNRGWVPFVGRRDILPEVRFAPVQPATITGRVDELPAVGIEAGRAAPSRGHSWPKVTSYPRIGQLEAALGRSLEKRVLLLDASAPYGYARLWRPQGTPPETHWSYAVQWWLFAVVLLVFYVMLNLSKIDGK